MKKNDVYENHLLPLIMQIAEICRAEKIAYVAAVSIPTEEDQKGFTTFSGLAGQDAPAPGYMLDAMSILEAGPVGTAMVRTVPVEVRSMDDLINTLLGVGALTAAPREGCPCPACTAKRAAASPLNESQMDEIMQQETGATA